MGRGKRCIPVLTVVVALALATVPSLAQAAPTTTSTARPWLDRELSPQQRARMLRAQMTLAEKIDLMTSDPDTNPGYAYYNAPIPRLGIPALKMADAGGGIAPRGWSLPGTGGKATAMPSEMALGATWSAVTAQQFGDLVGAEARETGQNQLLGPDADIARQPWYGRISESEGEDPTLNGELDAAYVNAVQAHQVIATMKHYTGYNQEVLRNVGQNTVVDERTLHEVYALAFETVIKQAHLGAVMCSYNKINGVYSCQNAVTLRTLLRGQLGFSGFVITDFGALHSTLDGLTGGTDMETGTATFYDGALLEAAQNGTASIAQIDEAVLHVLTTEFRLGLFDTDYTPTSIPVAAHDEVARQVEDQAVTLLKNSDNTLPLSGGSIALVGADADIASAESGSAWVDPTTTTSTLQGLTARAGADAVTWTPGNDSVNGASIIETASQTTVPSSVLSPASGSGTGLTTQYWHTPDFAGPAAVTRTEQQVSYDVGFPTTFPGWAGGGTQVPVPPTNFFLEQQSVKYDGYLTAPTTGTYTLSLTGWGDATMTLDGATVIDMTGKDGRRVVNTAPLQLTAGARHVIHIEYRATRPVSPLQPGTLVLQWKPPAGTTSPAIDAAVAAAKKADVAVVYVRDFESEERDRVSLKLPQSADALVRAVAAANPKTVVVLATGGPVTMPWLSSVAAVLQTHFGGQAEGAAVADVLFGDVNPSGHLTTTYPVRESDVPVTNPWDRPNGLNVTYSEGLEVGYRAYLARQITPQFPFGYGLSYTQFRVSAPPGRNAVTIEPDGSLRARVQVTNTGERAGADVVQVYVTLPATTGEPPKRLAAFTKVTLNPGESRLVSFGLRKDAPNHPLSYWDTGTHAWVTPSGAYRVSVGDAVTQTPVEETVDLR